MVDLSKISPAKPDYHYSPPASVQPSASLAHAHRQQAAARPGTAPFILKVDGYLASQRADQNATLAQGALSNWERSTVQDLQRAHEQGFVALRSVKEMLDQDKSETLNFELRGADRADVLGDFRASGQDEAFRLRLSSTLLPNAQCRTEQTRIHSSHVNMLYNLQASISKPDFFSSPSLTTYRDGAAKPEQNSKGRCSYQNQASPYRSKQSTAKNAVIERANWTPPRGMGRIAQMEGTLRPMNELVIKANHRDMFLGMAMEANIFCDAPALRYLQLIETQAAGLSLSGELLPLYIFHGNQHAVRDSHGVLDASMPTNTFLPISRSQSHVSAALNALSREMPDKISDALLKLVGAERIPGQAHTFKVLDDTAYTAALARGVAQQRSDMHQAVNQAVRYLNTQLPEDFELAPLLETHKAHADLDAKGIFNTRNARYPEISTDKLERYCKTHTGSIEAAQKLKQMIHLTFRLEARQQDFIQGNPVHFDNTQRDLNAVARL